MEDTAIVAIVGVVASLTGSVIGGAISHWSAQSLRRDEWANDRRRAERATRESLYAEFLSAAADTLNLMPGSEKATEKQISAAVARILALETKCLLRSIEVGGQARKICNWLVDALTGKAKEDAPAYRTLCDGFVRAAQADLKAIDNEP